MSERFFGRGWSYERSEVKPDGKSGSAERKGIASS
jgi:hypothetical protein